MTRSRPTSAYLAALVLATVAVACADLPTPAAARVHLEAAWTPPTTPFGFQDTVPGTPAVRALDDADRPVKDLRVLFVLYRPSLPSVSVITVTGPDGIAELPIRWVTGNRVGEQKLVALTPDGMDGDPVEFSVQLVAGPATALTLSLPSGGALLNVGDTVLTRLSFRDAAGNVVSAPATPTFQSSNSAVARVSSAGVVVASGHGTAIIVAMSAALADTVAVGVRNPIQPQFTLSAVPGEIAQMLEAAPGSLAFSAKYIFEPVVYRSNLTNGSRTSLGLPTGLLDLAFVPSRNELWASSATAARYYRVSLSPFALVDSVAVTHTFLRFDTAPLTGIVYGTGFNGAVTRINPADGSMITRSPLSGGEVNGIAFTPNGAAVFLSRLFPAALMKLDAATLVPSDSASFSGSAQAVEVDRTGTYLFVAVSGALQVRRASDLSLVTTLPGIIDAYDIKAAPTGDAIVVTRLANPGRIWALDPLTFEIFFEQATLTPRRIIVDEATGSFWIGTDQAQLLRLQRQ